MLLLSTLSVVLESGLLSLLLDATDLGKGMKYTNLTLWRIMGRGNE